MRTFMCPTYGFSLAMRKFSTIIRAIAMLINNVGKEHMFTYEAGAKASVIAAKLT